MCAALVACASVHGLPESAWLTPAAGRSLPLQHTGFFCQQSVNCSPVSCDTMTQRPRRATDAPSLWSSPFIAPFPAESTPIEALKATASLLVLVLAFSCLSQSHSPGPRDAECHPTSSPCMTKNRIDSGWLKAFPEVPLYSGGFCVRGRGRVQPD